MRLNIMQHTTLTAKVFGPIISIPIIFWNLSGPQNLRAFNTSYPVLCFILMATWSMTPIIITHSLVAPQTLTQHRQRKLKFLTSGVLHYVQKLLHLTSPMQSRLIPLVVLLSFHSLLSFLLLIEFNLTSSA